MSYDLAIPLLGLDLIEMHTMFNKKMYMNIFKVALSIIAQTGNNPKSISSRMVKRVVVYSYISVEYHAQMKK